MLWLIVSISAYLILAAVSLVDKYLLTKTTLKPKLYAFYIGLLQLLILVFIPFVGFYVPEKREIILSLLSGATFIFALFWLFKSLQLFEASKVVPAIGGLTPLFSVCLIYIFSLGQETLSLFEGVAFIFLISGSVLINIEKEKLINLKSLKFSAPCAFFLALSFVLIKYVYLVEPFWNAFIWRNIGGFLMSICFFFIFSEIRKEIFKKRNSFEKNQEEKQKFSKKEFAILISNQAAGASAGILQNWAIALAPLVFVPFVHALQGVQYVFILVLAAFLSFKFPQILKEEVSRKIIFQKVFAIFLIFIGLVLIFLK